VVIAERSLSARVKLAFFVELLRDVLPQSSEDHPRSEPMHAGFLRWGNAEKRDFTSLNTVLRMIKNCKYQIC
jgi:hypothetical protein